MKVVSDISRVSDTFLERSIMQEYVLENEFIKISFIGLGGTITSFVNKETNTNYILRYENLDDYLDNQYYMGATIGRLAGRTYPSYITDAKGNCIDLEKNEENKHLHGGERGYHSRQFQVTAVDSSQYELTLMDIDSQLEDLFVRVRYKLVGKQFSIEFLATAPGLTYCNLTNHMYFNLGLNPGTILNHRLRVAPAKLQLIDEHYIPTGEYVIPVGEYSPYSFEVEDCIQKATYLNHPLSRSCSDGIDLAYCFTNLEDRYYPKIELTSPDEKNRLRIYSDQEACVIYTLNKIGRIAPLSDGRKLQKFGGVTFEMQKRPNFLHQGGAQELEYSSWTMYEIF